MDQVVEREASAPAPTVSEDTQALAAPSSAVTPSPTEAPTTDSKESSKEKSKEVSKETSKEASSQGKTTSAPASNNWCFLSNIGAGTTKESVLKALQGVGTIGESTEIVFATDFRTGNRRGCVVVYYLFVLFYCHFCFLPSLVNFPLSLFFFFKKNEQQI